MTGETPPRAWVRRAARWTIGWCTYTYPKSFRDVNGESLRQTCADRIDSIQGGPLRIAAGAVAECANVFCAGVTVRWGMRRATRDHGPHLGGAPNPGAEHFFSVWHDVRYAVRTAVRQPAFVASAVALLALGIGINTAAFSIVHAYLLQPLPFPESDRLLAVGILDPAADADAMNTIPRGIHQVRWPARDDVVEHLVAWDLDGFSLVGDDQPESVAGSWVTPGFFAALETRPHLGRLLTPADAVPGAEPAAVISYGLWQRRFGGDSSIVGRSVTAYSTDRPLDPEIFTVVGVLPSDFWFLHRFTDFLPALTTNRQPSYVRVREGVTVEQARRHFTSLVTAQATAVDPDWTMFVRPAHEHYVRQVRPAVSALAAAVGLVLLIACGNVAMLLVVRALGRSGEFGIRSALGASRRRIVQLLLVEGGMLSVVAGGLGVLLANGGLALLAGAVEQQLGTPVPGGTDGLRVSGVGLLAALLATTATGLAFGMIPALAATPNRARLHGAGRNATGGPSRQMWRNTLMIGEVALSLSLLISAGLMVRTVLHFNRLNLGFDAENVLKANVSLRLRSYPDQSDRIAFVDRLLPRVEALPGVVSAGVTDAYPFRRPVGSRMQTQSTESPETGPRAVPHAVSPTYFATLRIRLVRGRVFDERDRANSEPVAIVSETLAGRLWPGENPLGQVIRDVGMGTGYDPDLPWRTVVGVVSEVRKTLTEEHHPDMYVPYRQNARPFMFIMARTAGDPLLIARSLQQAVWDLDPEQPIASVESMETVVASQGAQSRFLANALGAFALFGVGLALYGLYSVVSYSVTQQRRDVAIRIALGADYRSVTRLFVAGGGFVVGIGVLGGLAGSAVLARGLATQLHGVGSLDPLTYAALAVALLTAGLVATWIPARRAARCDPMHVLRNE